MVVQWLRIYLAMQGTLVWSLVQEDPTCLGAAKPGRAPLTTELTYSNCWSLCALQLMLSNKRSHHNGKPNTATESSACSLQLEKAHVRCRRPTTANKQIKKKKCHGKELRVTKTSSVQPCHYSLQDGENDMMIFKKLFFFLFPTCLEAWEGYWVKVYLLKL